MLQSSICQKPEQKLTSSQCLHRHCEIPDIPRAVCKKRYIILAALVVVVTLAVLRSGPREPIYEGRTLSFWLEQSELSWRLDMEAEEAVRHSGTNAIPTLLKWITTREGFVIKRALASVPLRARAWLSVLEVSDPDYKIMARHYRGAYGLAVLGERARLAVPDLIALLNDKDPDVRCVAAYAVGRLAAVAKDAVPSLITCLNDSDQFVRCAAVEALGEIHEAPERVVPALMGVLQIWPGDYASVIAAAFESLGAFGERAKPAVPMLLELLNDKIDRQGRIRLYAANTLKKIDPEAAAHAGVR